MYVISQCCECSEESCCWSQCAYCYEPLCEKCQSGHHQAVCVFEQSESYNPNAPLSEAQKAALVEMKDQHGQEHLEDLFDCYTC